MKLRKGKAAYPMPAYGQILHVHLETRPGDPLRAVMIRQVDAFPSKERGIPQYCAIAGDQIIFYPKPDAPYKAVIRYYPPAMEA